jgi:hypothetical protein
MDENWLDWSNFRHIILTWYKGHLGIRNHIIPKKMKKNDFQNRLKERLFSVSVQCVASGSIR